MARFSRVQVWGKMEELGLVPLFYNSDVEEAKRIVEALSAGGAKVIEFTNRGDRAFEVFRELIVHFDKADPSVILGVGSVLDVATAGLYINLGANFIVGSVTHEDVAKLCNRRKVAYCPGCGTASEVSKAEELGCEIVKVFPGSQLGGPAFVKAIKAPCPWAKIMPTGGIIPTAIEFMDKSSVEAACGYLNESLPYEKCGAMLLITVDGPASGQVEREYEAIGELCLACGAVEVYVADNFTTSERIWKVRRNIAEAFKVISPHQSLEDIVVPIASIPRMVEGLGEISRRFDVPIGCYGHAGDGNLHVNIIVDRTDRGEMTRARRAVTELFDAAISMGGTLSGEHGIGITKAEHLARELDVPALRTTRVVKRALDPGNIMNPEKILSDRPNPWWRELDDGPLPGEE